MERPAYQCKLEGMVSDQREILIGAAYGDSRIWESLATIYRFADVDQVALRSHIVRTYRPDGRPFPILEPDRDDGRRLKQMSSTSKSRD